MRTFPCGPSREGGCWASRAGGYLDCAEGHFAIRKWLQGFLKLAFQSNHHHHHPPPPPPTHTHTHPASQPGSRCAGWRKDGAQRSSQQKPSFTTNWLQHACNQWTLGETAASLTSPSPPPRTCYMAAGIHCSHRVPVCLMGQHPRLGFHKATPQSWLCRAHQAQAPGRRQLVCRLCYCELFNNVRATPSSLVIQTQSAVCQQRASGPTSAQP